MNRWVIHYGPKLENEFRSQYKRRVAASWRMDETYIKVKGEWKYLYHAVDKDGKTVDFFLTDKRDKQAALAFFIKALGSNGIAEKITIDKSGANKSALDILNLFFWFLCRFVELFFKIEVRQNKYLNNLIEQDHRGIKKIVNPMMGFKVFYSAEATLAGIELLV